MDQEQDRSDADAAPLVPRGHLRLLRHEHRRHQHAGLHQGHADEISTGRCASIRCRTCRWSRIWCRTSPSPMRSYHRHPARGCKTVSPQPAQGMAPEPRRPRRSSTASTSASCASAARPRARATGGTATAISGPAVLLQAYRWLIDSRDEGDGRAPRQSRGSVPALSLPHDHELHPGMPEGPQSGEGDRRDQEDDGRAAGVGRPWIPPTFLSSPRSRRVSSAA